MLKNDEWGAATYLYQSQYGKYGNNDYDIQSKLIFPNASGTTGNSAGRASGLMVDVSAYDDLTTSDTGKGQAGPGASTTGTIYGIYDMVGGLAEAVMGVLAYKGDLNIPMAGINDYSFSGFNGMVLYDYNRDDMSSEWNNHITDKGVAFPDAKYYNIYVGELEVNNGDKGSFDYASTACSGGVCYGHALSEIKGWETKHQYFIIHRSPWFVRGRDYSTTLSENCLYEVWTSKGYGGTTRFILTP